MKNKKSKSRPLQQKRLKELLEYNSTTGVFRWIVGRTGTAYAGKIAGGYAYGYHRISIDCVSHMSHRLVWLYVHGKFPNGQIDHINHDRGDNRIKNLRECSQMENHKNQKLNKNNKSGFCGVRWYEPTNKWAAEIYVKGKTCFLGYFEKKKDAILARSKANKKHGFHKNHGLPPIKNNK